MADSSNRVTSDALGTAASRTRHFDDRHDGALDSVLSKHGNQVLQSLTYNYDNKDNLIARSDAGGWSYNGATAAPHTENFCYDELDRVTDGTLDESVSCGHGNPYHYAYDADGNITSKSGEGTLTYDPAHPHALHSDGTDSYSYDLLGNQITRPRFPDPSGASGLAGTPCIQYSALDLPKAYFGGNVAAGAVNTCSGSNSGTATCYCGNVTDDAGVTTNWCSDFPITFQYDGNGSRIGKDTPDLSSFYVDGLYERVTDRNTFTTTHRYYIPTPAGVVGSVSRETLATGQVVAGSAAVQYTLTDHAGSADVVVDGSGATIERHSYDPFGRRRSATWTPDALTGRQASDPTLTGYTGQQDDFELGLINMKGRMYDPKIGRFLTPDPLIGGSPLQSQNLNHYSYVANNPLSFFDPTGLYRVEVNYAPTDGSDLEISIFLGSDPADTSVTYIFPDGGYVGGADGERVWGPVNNFGWGDLSRVNVQPLVDQIDKANMQTLNKVGQAYLAGAILSCLPVRVAVVLAGIGLLDPSPASAPPSDGTFQPAAQHSALRIAVGMGMPAALGAIGAGRGDGGADPEQIANIENQLGQKGGAGDEALPELEISESKYPELADNISNAQNAGHPDVLTHGGEAVADSNRAAATAGVPKLKGSSRDEYPFASSREGGAGSWVGHIPTWQQSAQGALITNFTRANGILPGMQYRVVITP